MRTFFFYEFILSDKENILTGGQLSGICLVIFLKPYLSRNLSVFSANCIVFSIIFQAYKLCEIISILSAFFFTNDN